MHQGKYTVNIYGNISSVVNINQQVCFFRLLVILFLQFAGVIVIALVSIWVSVVMLYYYIIVLDHKENQTDTVCIKS